MEVGFLQGLSEVSEVEITQLQRHGRAVADMKRLDGRCSDLALREMEKPVIYASSPGHDFVCGCNERAFFCNFHISTICQQSHLAPNFKIFTMSIFQPFANNFACQPLSTFSTTCRIWRSPTMCNNFSDAFVGGRFVKVW